MEVELYEGLCNADYDGMRTRCFHAIDLRRFHETRLDLYQRPIDIGLQQRFWAILRRLPTCLSLNTAKADVPPLFHIAPPLMSYTTATRSKILELNSGSTLSRTTKMPPVQVARTVVAPAMSTAGTQRGNRPAPLQLIPNGAYSHMYPPGSPGRSARKHRQRSSQRPSGALSPISPYMSPIQAGYGSPLAGNMRSSRQPNAYNGQLGGRQGYMTTHTEANSLDNEEDREGKSGCCCGCVVA